MLLIISLLKVLYHSISEIVSSRSAYSKSAAVSSFSLIFLEMKWFNIFLYISELTLIFGPIWLLYHISSVTAAARLFPNFSISSTKLKSRDRWAKFDNQTQISPSIYIPYNLIIWPIFNPLYLKLILFGPRLCK